MPIDPAALRTAIQRVVDAVHPLEIIAFGSRARGEAKPDSDLDLLVIFPEISTDAQERRSRRIGLRKLLADMPFSKDILVSDKQHLATEQSSPVSVYSAATRQGLTLWAGKLDEAACQRICY